MAQRDAPDVVITQGSRVRAFARVYDRVYPTMMHADKGEVGEVLELVDIDQYGSMPLRLAHVAFGSMVAVVSVRALEVVP